MAEEFGLAPKQPEEIEETSKSTQAAVEDRPKRRSTPEVASRRLPQRPEEYQLEQNTLRKVYDPMTGRTRLVKGTGEIIEEIVSREKHKEINRQATAGDGTVYASVLRSIAKHDQT
ncbi:hypothetical protein HDU83_002611 [Entophlyctis luteolus]|nr:hypothetical protein HDU83_002611 [Entophlyctis luteolus]